MKDARGKFAREAGTYELGVQVMRCLVVVAVLFPLSALLFSAAAILKAVGR